MNDVDPDAVREFHRRFITGVTVVTTMDGPEPRGLAVNAFCSVSLEPPVVLVCVKQSSTTYPALLRATHFAVNILAADQLDVARTFATKRTDKFAGLGWTPAGHGSPLLTGAAAAMEVEVTERQPAGTHTMFLGLVVEARHRETDPLVYRAGGFFSPTQLLPL